MTNHNQHGNCVIDSGVFEQADDAVINAHRFRAPIDGVMERYDEAGNGCLPSDQELDTIGVDRVVLARELQNGLTASKFTRALRHGLDVDAFNNSPVYREEGRLSLEECLDYFLDHARLRSRKRLPANRALASLGVTI